MHRLWLATAALLTALSYGHISHAETLRIATMAPRQSAWGKVFHAWSQAVHKKSHGKLKLRFYWNATQGDEGTVVAKLRSGQIDGCTLGASGLGKIHKPALALQMPGLFRSWKGIDRATAALYPELSKAFEKQGFYLSSIGDVGRAHTMSRGRAVRVPADVKGMKPASPRRGVIAPVMASMLEVTPVRLSLPELLPALSSGRINLITAPALAAEQLQWAPYFDHINADIAGIGVGAMVFNSKTLQGLPPDVVEVMRKTGKRAGKILRKRVRKMDDDAYKRLSKRMTVVKLTAAERRQWSTLFAKVRRRLAQRTFPPELVKRLEALGEH